MANFDWSLLPSITLDSLGLTVLAAIFDFGLITAVVGAEILREALAVFLSVGFLRRRILCSVCGVVIALVS